MRRRKFLANLRRCGMAGALITVALLLLQSAVFAQQTGMISGTVSDPSGAVIANAKITLTNAASKAVRQSVTNGEGLFVFSAAVTGDYSVKIEAQGFKTREQTGVHLSPGDRRNLTVQMTLAKQGETVTVEAAPAQIQVVDSGERSSILSSKDIKNMALQGRDVTELTKTLPGFNVFTGGGGLANKGSYDPSIAGISSAVGNGFSNGTPNRTGTDLLSDGAHIIDPGCNCNATQTVNADMVQEVKVSTSAFGADSAKGPVVIQAVGKSGSTEYHGGAYLHFRDSSMNSNDWNTNFNKVAKPKDRYWYPGGNFGGPIPHTNKKATFWTGYENYRQSFPDQVSNGVVKAVVPTMSMRAGNFDPAAADNAALCSLGGWMPQCGGISSIKIHGVGPDVPITNNNIANYIDAGGAAIMKEIVQPNFTPDADHPYNFVKGVMSYGNGYMWHSRVDYHFNDTNTLYVSYNQQRDDNATPVMMWWMPPNEQTFPGGTVQWANSKTISGNLVTVFSPTLTNELIASTGYLKTGTTYSTIDGVSRSALGYPYHGIFGQSKVMPMLSTAWWIPGYPMIYQPDADGRYERKMLPAFSDNLTKVYGTHTLKFGVNWEKVSQTGININEQNGSYQFGTSGASGNPVANILLGVPTYYEESSANTLTDMAFTTLSGFVQDDWKVTPRLTLNLGARISHDSPWTDGSGKTGVATWTRGDYAADIATGKTNMPGMRWNGMDSSVPMSGRTVQPVLFSPRFGLAYDLFGTGKTLLRGGIGTYYYHDAVGVANGGVSTAQGGKMCKVNSATWLGDIDNGVNVNCAAVQGATAVDPNDHATPVTYTYNFTISQKMPKDTLLEVAYSGNQTKDMASSLTNRNIIPLGAFFGKNPVTGVVESIYSIEKGYRVDANGNKPKDASGNEITTTVTKDQYRPMQEYATLNVNSHGDWANYNSLQVSWNKPRGKLTYGVNYTFSKTLGINSSVDPVNVHNDYGVMSQDRTHVLNLTYAYEVATHFRGIMGNAINGWMISGITSLQSGGPLGQMWSRNYGLGGTSGENTYNGFYLDSTAFLGSSDYTLMPTFNCNPATRSNGAYLNASCLNVPAYRTNGAYQTPYVHGPMYWNSDIALQKTVRISERQNVQVKVSAFNFLNHALTSFDPSNQTNLTFLYSPTNTSLTNYEGYTGGYALVKPSGNKVLGKPDIKFGRRVVELTVKYNF